MSTRGYIFFRINRKYYVIYLKCDAYRSYVIEKLHEYIKKHGYRIFKQHFINKAKNSCKSYKENGFHQIQSTHIDDIMDCDMSHYIENYEECLELLDGIMIEYAYVINFDSDILNIADMIYDEENGVSSYDFSDYGNFLDEPDKLLELITSY